MFALVLNKSSVKPPALIVITALGIIAGARLVLDGRAGATEVEGTSVQEQAQCLAWVSTQRYTSCRRTKLTSS